MTFVNTLKTVTLNAAKTAAGVAGGLALVFAITGIPAKALAQDAAHPPIQGKGPALFVVKDEDSTLYLFGTVHVLRPTTGWNSPAVQTAFNSADEVWLEVTDPNDQASIMPLVQQYGLSPDRPLSSLLTAEEIASLDAAASALGMNAAQADIFRPWLAAVTVAMSPLLKAGYDPNSGVDNLLRARALEAGKPVKGLEDLEFQIRMLATMPEDQQLEFLRQSLELYQDASTILDGLVAAWAEGDVEGIDNLMVKDMKADTPEIYDAMLTRRNTNWADQIQTMLQGSGTAFIAVGAAHLAGEDSVQAILAQRGVTATRVNP